MGDKKRKLAAAPSDPPMKKTRKSMSDAQKPKSENLVVSDPDLSSHSEVIPPHNGIPATSQKNRKRAVDFMSEEEDKPSSQKKKTRAPKAGLLSADGTNGVLEHSEDEGVKLVTTTKPTKDSLMAEAERTADAELEEEFGGIHNDEDSEQDEIDQTPALLAGFDSDNDDPAEDTPFDKTRTPPIPQFKKTSKKLRNAQKSDGPGAVYIGRIPHGFYEQEMRSYFTQFGNITRLRLSRNKRTGASKHFAFIEFESEEVAKIVAETMDNYLMFGHILKCKFAPAESLHPDVWKGANKKFRKLPHHRITKQKEQQPRTVGQWEKKNEKEKKRREKKATQMKAIGYEFHMPELADPGAAMEKAKITKEAESQEAQSLENSSVPVPEVIKKNESAKSKKGKKDKKDVAAGTIPEQEQSATTDHQAVPEPNGTPILSEKKSKKVGKQLNGNAAGSESADPKNSKTQIKTKEVKSKDKQQLDKQPKSILKKTKKA